MNGVRELLGLLSRNRLNLPYGHRITVSGNIQTIATLDEMEFRFQRHNETVLFPSICNPDCRVRERPGLIRVPGTDAAA